MDASTKTAEGERCILHWKENIRTEPENMGNEETGREHQGKPTRKIIVGIVRPRKKIMDGHREIWTALSATKTRDRKGVHVAIFLYELSICLRRKKPPDELVDVETEKRGPSNRIRRKTAAI